PPCAPAPFPTRRSSDLCARRPPPWRLACAAWRYAFPVDRLLQELKYGGRLALAEPLADGLAAAVHASASTLPDCIVPLPLSRARSEEHTSELQSRGHLV